MSTVTLGFICWCSYTRTPFWDKIWLQVRTRPSHPLEAQGWEDLILHAAFLLVNGHRDGQMAAPFTQAHSAMHPSEAFASNKLVERITVIHLLLPDYKALSTYGTSCPSHYGWYTHTTSQANLWFLPSDLNILRTIFCEAITVSGPSPDRFSGLQKSIV